MLTPILGFFSETFSPQNHPKSGQGFPEPSDHFLDGFGAKKFPKKIPRWVSTSVVLSFLIVRGTVGQTGSRTPTEKTTKYGRKYHKIVKVGLEGPFRPFRSIFGYF